MWITPDFSHYIIARKSSKFEFFKIAHMIFDDQKSKILEKNRWSISCYTSMGVKR